MPPERQHRIEPGHFSADIVEFIRLLDKHEVQCVLVGGEAVIFHGHIRFTGDVDFFYSAAPENVKALFGALLEFWDGNIPGLRRPEELAEPALVIQFGRPPNRIDLLNRIDGVTFEEAWSSRIPLTLAIPHGEVTLGVLGLPELLKNKRASGRPKDLEDLRFFEMTSNDTRPAGSCNGA